jgi:hypothetical protein
MEEDMGKNSDLEKLSLASMHLLANRLLGDYLAECANHGSPEAEHFFEEWIRKNIFHPTIHLQTQVWRFFISSLISYRKEHKI